MQQQLLAAQTVEAKEGKKEAHVYEQYLTRILKELLRSEDGDIPNTVSAYTEGKQSLTILAYTFITNEADPPALEEISRELMPINERRVLKNGHTPTKDINGVDNAPEKVKLREAERARRAAIRSRQEEISFYFFVHGSKKISGADLLLFSKFATLTFKETFYSPNRFSYRLPENRPHCFPGAYPSLSFRRQAAKLDSCLLHTVYIRTCVFVLSSEAYLVDRT